MRILHISAKDISQAFPHAAKWLEKAFVRCGSPYPMSDLRDDIILDKKRLFKLVNGKYFAWIVIGCVKNSAFMTCWVHAIGGKGVLNFLPEIVEFCELYAKKNQCLYIRCTGRSGWVKEIGKFGWNELTRTCGKEI